MPTIFTKIINKEIPAKIVYEDDKCVAFKDTNPQAPVHILIIPRKEIASMDTATEADKEILGHVMLKAAHIAREQGIAEDGYRLVVNTNSYAGQTVFHIHVHIIGGRELGWPPG